MKLAEIRHRGRAAQIPIYLGKFLRMFLFMDDWKVIPMAIVVSGLVGAVACTNMFVYQEATYKGALALVSVCIWNGFFNSVQVVCRERSIIKREHRSGMHISSYVAAHMLYQAFLCLLQSIIMTGVCVLARVRFPAMGFMTWWFVLDLTITFFLVTYAADMTSLFLSCIVKNTTAAMTVMPFLLIFELIFSGGMFELTGPAAQISRFTIAYWGMRVICTLGNYNALPMVTVWNMLFNFRGQYSYEGFAPIEKLTNFIMDTNQVDAFCLETAKSNIKPIYDLTVANVAQCWGILVLMAAIFAVLAVLSLEGIDRDKR